MPSDFQFSYNGLTIGDGTDYDILSVTGLGLAGIRSADVYRSQDHGQFRGTDYGTGRQVELSVEVLNSSLETLMGPLRNAFVPNGDTELPLSFQLPGQVSKRVECRVRDFVEEKTVQTVYGMALVQIRLWATSPFIFADTEQDETVNLPTASGGMTFPATFNLSFGTVSTGGSFTATNEGNAPSRPVFVITGPVDNPRIENVTAGQTLSFNISLATGETLTLDTDARSVLLNGSASRRSTLTGQWFELAPGDSTIRYQANTYSAGSTLQATWRSAWWNT